MAKQLKKPLLWPTKSALSNFMNRANNRPIVLILTVFSSVTFVAFIEFVFSLPSMQWAREFILQSRFLGDLFFPSKTPDWKDKLTAMLPIIGLPVAFWLWLWRDQNTQNSLESTKKDVNLKEFQHVFNSAAGIFDADLDQNAKTTAQIASLHHLRAFLRGEYGRSFQRPAFELLLAGHCEAVKRTGLIEMIEHRHDEKDFAKKLTISNCINICRSKLSEVDKARITIIREDYKFIFGLGYPLTSRFFDFIDFGWGSDFHEISIPINTDFRGSSFIGSSFCGIIATGCDFESCDFSGANLSYSDLRRSRFWDAKFDQADLTRASLTGSNVATVSPYTLMSCNEALIDEDTWLAPAWGHIDDEVRKDRQRRWLSQGAEWAGEDSRYEQLNITLEA